MSNYSNNHILYGNHGLSNRRVQVRELGFLDASPNEVQAIPLPRASGSSVVRTRTGAKTIRLAGGTTYTNSTQDEDSVLNMATEVNKIFSYDGRYLRTVPKSKMIMLDECQATTGWTASNDAGAVTLDTRDFEWEKASLSSAVTVATSGNNTATYTKTLTTPVNLSPVSQRGNLEGWFFVSQGSQITLATLRFGNAVKNLLLNTNSLPTSNYTYSNTTRSDGPSATPVTGSTSALATITSLVSPLVRMPAIGQDLALSAGSYTYSIYVKAGTTGNISHIRIRHINTENGTTSDTIKAITSGTSVGSGWYRHSFTRTLSTATTNNRWSLEFFSDGTGTVASVASNVELGEVQVELSSTPTQYQTQGASAAPQYLEAITSSNYENRAFENGWNYISIPWGNDVQEQLLTPNVSVDVSNINALQFELTHSSTSVDYTAKLGGFFHVQETFCRNYKCYRQGGINFEPYWYVSTDNLKNDFELELLNTTGYGQATHAITLFNQTGITTATNTQRVSLLGSFQPALIQTFNLNSTTNLTNLSVTNLTTNEAITWTNSWADGDVVEFNKLTNIVTRNAQPQPFTGVLPNATYGVNTLQMQITTGSSVSTTYNTGSSVRSVQATLSGITYTTRNYAQSFTTTSAGTLTSFSVYGYMWNVGDLPMPISIQTDSGGSPSGTKLWSGTFFGNSISTITADTFAPNITVSNATVYWIVLEGRNSNNIGFRGSSYFWGISSSAYGSGEAKNDSSGSYTSTGDDQQFSVTIEPTPSTDIDWSCSYYPLYA